VSARTVIRLLLSIGVSRLFTVNVHNPAVFEGSGLGLTDLSAIPLLAKHLEGRGLGGSFSLSLGKKPVDLEHAMEAASVLGGGHAHLETFRDPTTGEVHLGGAEFDVGGRRVIVFDDVITSGGTHLGAVRLLRGMGASEAHLACVHSLLSDENLARVLGEVNSFTCTDTVPGRFSGVKVAPLIAGALRRYLREVESESRPGVRFKPPNASSPVYQSMGPHKSTRSPASRREATLPAAAIGLPRAALVFPGKSPS